MRPPLPFDRKFNNNSNNVTLTDTLISANRTAMRRLSRGMPRNIGHCQWWRASTGSGGKSGNDLIWAWTDAPCIWRRPHVVFFTLQLPRCRPAPHVHDSSLTSESPPSLLLASRFTRSSCLYQRLGLLHLTVLICFASTMSPQRAETDGLAVRFFSLVFA